jgi:hypothetical protein
MRAKELLAYLLVALLTGCVPSLHPLYTEKELVMEEQLSGLWFGEEQIWKFEADENEKSYELTIIDEDLKRGEFIAHLVRLDNMLFLDLFPGELELQANNIYKIHLLPAHTFLKVEQIKPTLKMRAMNPDELQTMLKEDPSLLKHEIIKDNRLVLTASTKQLQQFMRKYAKQKDLFGDAVELKRVQLEEPDEDEEK